MEAAYQRGSWWMPQASFAPWMAAVDPSSVYRFGAALTSGAAWAIMGFVGSTKSASPPVAPASLPPDVVATFRGGNYTARVLQEPLTVYRSEGRRFGQWYGTIKPDSAASAERLYNVVAYGNDLTEVSTYRIPAGTIVYEGPVEGGTGWQVYIPDPLAVGVQYLGSQPLPQWGF